MSESTPGIMRFPDYISPSSLALFRQNRERYFIKYMAGIKHENIQTEPMSVGSAFDCFVKDRFMRDLGLGTYDEFEKQVDKHLWDFARVAGMRCFDHYYECGAYETLLRLLEVSIVTPRFEFEMKRNIDGVPIKGYPDCFFITPQHCPVVLDFKVNGYCSATGVKPKQTFITSWPPMKVRKAVQRKVHRGMMISLEYFDYVDKSWATQLSMYAWMLGHREDAIIGIEQLAWKNDEQCVARHVGRTSPKFKEQLLADLQEMWACIQSGNVCEGQEEILASAGDECFQLLG